MTPEQFQSIGRTMFAAIPHYWTEALGGALGINARTVQRWANGQNPIPDEIAANVLAIERISKAGRAEAERRRQEA